MSLYGEACKIDGLRCGLVMRGGANGQYRAVFEREFASLERIETINWSRPTVEGDTVLPAGYGYEVKEIEYDMNTCSYTVHLQVAEQYLGDVAGFQAQMDRLEQEVDTLEGTVAEKEAAILEKDQQLTARDEALAEKDAKIQAMEAAGTAAQVDEQLAAAYEEGVEQNG